MKAPSQAITSEEFPSKGVVALRAAIKQRSPDIIASVAGSAGLLMDKVQAFARGDILLSDAEYATLTPLLFGGQGWLASAGEVVPLSQLDIKVTLKDLKTYVRDHVGAIADLEKATKIDSDELVQFAFTGKDLKDFQIVALVGHVNPDITYRDGQFVSAKQIERIEQDLMPATIPPPKYPDYRLAAKAIPTLQTEAPEETERRRRLVMGNGITGTGQPIRAR